jgi:hypothetical protein
MVNGFYTQMAKVKPNSVVTYNKWNGTKSVAMQNANLLDNFKVQDITSENIEGFEKFVGGKMMYAANREARRRYCGQMTKGSRKRMIEIVELFSSVVKERQVWNKYQRKWVKHTFSFITLTIPENNRRVKGKEGYEKLLAPFIAWLRERKVNTYIWKAELQSPLDFQGRLKISKGQLHYHLIIPNWIDKVEIRDKWNQLLMSRNLNAGHVDAPSTSIEKPYKSKDVAAYIVKEICKNTISTRSIAVLEKLLKQAELQKSTGCIALLEGELKRVIELQELQDTDLGGKIWGCSVNLKPKKKLVEIFDKGFKLEEIDMLIEESTRKIKDIQNDYTFFALPGLSKGENFFSLKMEVLLNEKRMLYFLKKERLRFYNKEKNYFEVEFTANLFDRLNLVYQFLEDSGDWNKNRNIFENDYVIIYKLPSYYWEIMLDSKHYDTNGKHVRYLDKYKDWYKERVGDIFVEESVF